MGKLNWKTLIPLSLIFILYAVLRFYDLQHRTVFNWDQEQFSNQILQLVQDHKPTLLGPRVNNDFGFYLAPYFTYLLAPFYLLTKMHPFAMIIFQIFVNTGFFILAYKIVSKLFGVAHALFFLFLWTISYMIQDLETITWWPILIPPGILLLWYLESKLFKNPQETKFWIMTGIIAGFFMNMHFQFIFVLAQVGLFGLVLKSQNKKVLLKNIFIAIGGFLLMFAPLFIFDLRNNFLNSQLFVNYFLDKNTIYSVTYSDWPYIFANMFLPYIQIKTPLAGSVTLLALLISTVYLWKKTAGFKSLFYLTNGVMVVFSILGFTVLNVRPSEYYFLFLTPIFLVTLIDLFLLKKLIYPLLALCALLLFINTKSLKLTMEPNFDSLGYKDDLVKDIQHQVGDKRFFISFDGPPGSDGGFRYLLKVRGLNSSPDGRNPQIQVKSPAPNPGSSFGGFGVVYPVELKR